MKTCDYCDQPLTADDLALGFYDANSKNPVCENCADFAELEEERIPNAKSE